MVGDHRRYYLNLANALVNASRKNTPRLNRSEQASQNDAENESCTYTQFLQIQKKQLIDLQEHLERYCNVSPVFGFNSAKYDLNFEKSYLLPILVNERNIEPTVIKKTNQFICFKFGDVQFFDTMNILGGATSLDSSLKANKTSETKILPSRTVRSPWQDAKQLPP